MSLFQCERCGARENTALVDGYWMNKGGKQCSECKTGKWHGEFDKILLPLGMFKTNSQGNLEHKETGETDCKIYAL